MYPAILGYEAMSGMQRKRVKNLIVRSVISIRCLIVPRTMGSGVKTGVLAKPLQRLIPALQVCILLNVILRSRVIQQFVPMLI